MRLPFDLFVSDVLSAETACAGVLLAVKWAELSSDELSESIEELLTSTLNEAGRAAGWVWG